MGENIANMGALQFSLFEPADGVLLDDARGQVTYTPRFLSADDANALFHELIHDAEWNAQKRMMYERELDVPRLMFSYKIQDGEKPLPPLLRRAAEKVIETINVPFTNIGVNLYRDGKDSVAPHNDHLHELQQGKPIVLLSLGATRRMTVRAKQPPKRVLHTDLEAGSLFVMSYDTQIHYTHGIPKTDEIVGPRISLAFRVRPDGDKSSRYWVGTRTPVTLPETLVAAEPISRISKSNRSSD